MSNINYRTVQRAEANKAVQLETIASMASALQVKVNDITFKTPPVFQNLEPISERQNAVVLRPCSSGKVLLDIIQNSFSCRIDCKAEPTAHNIEILSHIVEIIERYLPEAWLIPSEKVSFSLAENLRISVRLTKLILELEKYGIGIFAGHYTAKSQVPRYDYYENCMYVRTNQEYEPVTISHVLIAPKLTDRITIQVDDEWKEPEQKFELKDLEDEIPF